MAAKKKVGKCFCCLSPDVPVRLFKQGTVEQGLYPHIPAERYLCDLCSRSMVSTITKGFRGTEYHDVLKTICFVGNEIVKRLDALERVISDLKKGQ